MRSVGRAKVYARRPEVRGRMRDAAETILGCELGRFWYCGWFLRRVCVSLIVG